MYLLGGGEDFNDAAVRATQIAGLIFALAYLHSSVRLSWRSLGWLGADGNAAILVLRSFIAGAAIMAGLAASLYLLGIHVPVPGRDISLSAIGILIVKALITGFAVAAFEETLFRGALLSGLLRRSRHAAAAVVVVSLVYAAVHFIDYPALSADEAAGWLTGPRRFAGVITGLFEPETLDAFLALFTLGLLLGWMRLRDGHILRCIGVHAGLVATVKISRYFLAYEDGSRFDYLVSSHDHRLGYLAFLWLLIATLVYYVLDKATDTKNNKQISS